MGNLEDKLEEKFEHLARTFELEGELTRTRMAAALGESIRGLRIDGAAPRALRAGLVYGGAGRLTGWSVREAAPTPAAAAVDLYDGITPDAVDPARLVASFSLAAGGQSHGNAMPAGVSFTEGLFAVFTGTGLPVGAIWRGAVD